MKPGKNKPAKQRKTRRGSTAARVERTESLRPPIPTVEVKAEIDEEAWDAEGLTVRNRKFVEAILGPAGGNASKAAALAGYRCENSNSLGATASEILKRPKVREAIARRLAGANLTPEWIREMTAALAASNMGNFIALDDKGEPQINWREAERLGAFVQIRKFKEKGFKLPGEGQIDIIERTIETHNPAPFLQLLARMLSIVTEPGITVNVAQMSEHDLVRIARAAEADNPAAGGNRIIETAAGS